MMPTKDVGDIKDSSATAVTRQAFGGGGVTVRACVSSQYRTE